MLKSAQANIANSLRAQLPRSTSARGCLEGIKKMSEERRTAQRVIAAEYAPDEMAGILLSDGYDALFIAAIDSLAQSYLSHDKDLPASEAGAYFREKLADLPPVDETPAAFIVAFVILRCVQAAQSPPETLSPEVRADLSEVAVRAAGGVARQYRESRLGTEAKQKADEMWQASVIERVRCKTHSSSYSVVELRTGIRNDGSFYRRYVAKCQGGQETRTFDFDLEALNELTRSGGVQKLPPRLPTPATRQPGVDQ